MPKIFHNQQGIVSPLILLVSIGALIFLVIASSAKFGDEIFSRLYQRIPSHAASDTVSFVDSSGNPVSETSSSAVKIKLVAPWPAKPAGTPIPSETPTASPESTPTPSDRFLNNPVTVSGKIHEAGASRFSSIDATGSKIFYCDPDLDGVENFTTTDKLGKFSFQVEKGQKYCIKPPIIPGFKALSNQSKVIKTYAFNNQIAGYDCKGVHAKDPICSDKTIQKEDRPIDSNLNIPYQKDPKYTPTSKPTPTPDKTYTQTVSISEDPTFPNDDRTKTFDYTSNPLIVDYPFYAPPDKQAEAGIKTIYVQFVSSTGKIEQGNPYPARITLVVAKPDLVPTRIFRGDSGYNVWYCNFGSGTSDAKFNVSLTNLITGKTFTNEQDLQTVGVPQSCGGIVSFTCSDVGSTCLDEIQVEAIIDSKNTVDEQWEVNNQLTQSFTGQTADYVRVTAPNGGESYNLGDKVKITWDASSNMKSFKIALNFTGVGYQPSIFTVDDPAARSFEWTVDDIGYLPDETKPAKIVVTGFSQDGQYKTDQSDNSFNISPQKSPYVVRITNPIGDVSYKNGTTLRVMWEAEGADAGFVLYYEYWNGKYFMPDYLGDPQLRSYNWKIDIGNFGTYKDALPVRLIIEAYKKGVAAPVATFTTNYFTVTR